MTQTGPHDHSRVADELRILLDSVADRAQPWLNQLREPAEGSAPHGTCGWCPICATVSLARGERPELAERLATHAVGLISTLRAAMEPQPADGAHRAHPGPDAAAGSAGSATGPEETPMGAKRRSEPDDDPEVQHITVERPSRV